MAKLGTVTPETDDERRRRVKREYQAKVDDRAQYLVENDPELGGDMRKARAAAREQLALENAWGKGELDEDGDKPKRSRRRPSRAKSSSKPATGSKHRSSRSTNRAGRLARSKSVRAIVAPYGSAASAGWTLVTGSLSLVLFYVLLRDADVIADFTNGVVGTIKRIGDPDLPLIPTKSESQPPPPRVTRVVQAGRRSQRPGIQRF